MRFLILMILPTFTAMMPFPLAPPHDPPFATAPDDRPSESARVSERLARVEHDLIARDVSDLAPERRAARRWGIRALHEYRSRGVFPSDRGMLGGATCFVDHRGARSALAYLMEQSGDGALLRRVAASANHTALRDLAGDPELRAWLERIGFTFDEAVKIHATSAPFAGDEGPGTNARSLVSLSRAAARQFLTPA